MTITGMITTVSTVIQNRSQNHRDESFIHDPRTETHEHIDAKAKKKH